MARSRVSGASRLQIVEQWCVAGTGRSAEQAFALCKIAFGDCDHALRQLFARAYGPAPAVRFAEEARCLPEFAYQPYHQHENDETAEENRHRHFDQVAAEGDEDAARVGKQEVGPESADNQRDNNNQAQFHCALSLSVRNCRSRRSDPEMSGTSVANT